VVVQELAGACQTDEMILSGHSDDGNEGRCDGTDELVMEAGEGLGMAFRPLRGIKEKGRSSYFGF
jgi:hypothetical protein